MKFTTFPENINPFEKKGIVKLGIDPTGPELHLGHLLPIKLVKQFMENGCDIHIVLGTFTAQIGDATGRDATRPILSAEETKKNAENILSQIKRVLGDNITVHFNSDWLKDIPLWALMDLISNFSVQKLLDRDNFAKRMEKNIPIAMHELMGPILQGIDSFQLKTNIEVGGTDQLFNFVISREIQEIKGQKPEICVFSPVINGLDGRKMSKSFGNCIFLNDTPKNVFGKAMSVSDEVMRQWLPIFFETVEEKHPMVQKKELAHKITCDIWGSEMADEALANFENTIQNKELPKDMPEINVDGVINVVKTILGTSNSDARRHISSNAVRVNGEKVNETAILKPGDVVKVGKLKYAKIV
jgi:tyrosyl-tRNA synthetase